MTAWATLAIAFATGTALAFVVLRRRSRTLVGFLVAFAVVVRLWLQVAPSNDRDWQPEVSRLAYADVDGERITLHNIRNFDYRTETDFIPGWYDATFELPDLRSADLIACYWMGEASAHVMVSLGDERDLIRVRTNYREPKEDVYVYRAQVPLENVRRLLLDYVRKMNELKDHPAFYNTLSGALRPDGYCRFGALARSISRGSSVMPSGGRSTSSTCHGPPLRCVAGAEGRRR